MEDPARELEARVAARVGTEIKGKYRLERVLGTGGMAAVYAATHRNGKRVALKVLHPEVSAVPDLRARFLREGYAANKVGHPGVVGVADDDVTDDGAAFLVMDRLDGETLGARWLKTRRFEARAVLDIADQLLDVLVAAHGAGVVHRDIKPDNLFLTADGSLKVLDFGIARVRELSAATKGATYAGAVMGTPAFMPPEQARSRWSDVDAQSDLWAVGATMFTLLAGRFVHDGETANEQLAQAITRPAPPVAKVAPDVPADVGAIVDRALMYEKGDRFKDAREMRAAVRAALSARDRIAPGAFVTAPTVAAVSSSGGETLLTSESTSRTSQPARGRTIAIACGSAAAAIAIAAALLGTGGTGHGGAAQPVAAETAAASASSPGPAAPEPSVEPVPADDPRGPDGGTTLDVDALPEASGAAKARGPRGPAAPTATEGGAKTKKRRNLGF